MNAGPSHDDFMRAALAQAEKGRYAVTPNPAVGCVLVRDGVIIGHGYHARAGAPHAEIAALNDAGEAVGATAYVTLEPCNHHGRTGPCSEALIAAGIKAVVYATPDPNPAVSGGGAARLRAAGVAVTGGVGQAAAELLMRGFLQLARTGRPFVRLKLAMSLDAGAALADGQSQWITGPDARAEVQQLRAESCAVVTGIGTVLADDPALTVRDPRFELSGRQPRRVVLDSDLRMAATARMLTLPGETMVFTRNTDAGAAEALRAAGASVVVQPAAAGPHVDLEGVLGHLATLGVNHVLIEAGPTLAGHVIATAAFDELVVYVAPKLLGRDATAAIDVASPLQLADAPGLRLHDVRRVGEDVALIFAPHRSA